MLISLLLLMLLLLLLMIIIITIINIIIIIVFITMIIINCIKNIPHTFHSYFTFVNINVSNPFHTHAHPLTRTHIFLHTHTYTHISSHTHTYLPSLSTHTSHTHTHTHIHIYTHTHTCRTAVYHHAVRLYTKSLQEMTYRYFFIINTVVYIVFFVLAVYVQAAKSKFTFLIHVSGNYIAALSMFIAVFAITYGSWIVNNLKGYPVVSRSSKRIMKKVNWFYNNYYYFCDYYCY